MLGFALAQAALVGGILGLLAYFRVHRYTADDEGRPFLYGVREALESWEWATFDWRARVLADRPPGEERVVLVALDDETLANARHNDRRAISVQPWPRALLGELAGELVREGASQVLLAADFSEASPRACPQPLDGPAEADLGEDDDAALRAELGRMGPKSVVGFLPLETRGPKAASPLTPFGVRVSQGERLPAGWEGVSRGLAEGRRLFAVGAGGKEELWAGAASADDARDLATRWRLPGPPPVRALTAQDLDRPVTDTDLLLSLAEVQVDGLSGEALAQMAEVSPPVPQLLSPQSGYGALTLLADADGKVRAAPLLVAVRDRKDGRPRLLPSAPLAVAMRLAGDPPLSYRGGKLWVGDRFSLPMDPRGFSLIRWEHGGTLGANTEGVRAVSVWNVLLNLEDHRRGRPRHSALGLESKAVVLADTAAAHTAGRDTALGTASPGAVEGQVLANLLGSTGLKRVEPRVDFWLTVVWAFLGALIAVSFSGALQRPWSGALLTGAVALLGVGHWVVARSLFVNRGLWIAVVDPWLALAAGFLLSAGQAQRAQRELSDLVRSMLGRAVNEDVGRQVSSNLSLVRPERRSVTVLFADIQGFSALAAALQPAQLLGLMNEYFAELTRIVRERGGQVDTYVGGNFTAFWGAPVPNHAQAQAACDAALDILDMLERSAPGWERAFGRRLSCSIGVNTGEAVVGEVGTEVRSRYTAVGEVVKVAALLQETNQRFGTGALVAESTVDGARRRTFFREVERLRVPGRAEPVRAHELVGRGGTLSKARARALESFARAMDAYQRQRFQEALPQFEALAAADPVAQVYRARCEAYLREAPPQDWDGVFGGS